MEYESTMGITFDGLMAGIFLFRKMKLLTEYNVTRLKHERLLRLNRKNLCADPSSAV